MLEWPTKDAQPFRDIIAHRRLVPILNTIFGRGWRMDQGPFMYTSTAGYTGEPGGGMSLHGGQTWGVHEGQNGGGMGAYYRYANGVMRTGMVVCAFQLSDVEAGDGGFGCIPASHKSNFIMPAEVHQSPTRDVGTPREGLPGDGLHAPVVNPACSKGGMILFLEAVLHTTLP